MGNYCRFIYFIYVKPQHERRILSINSLNYLNFEPKNGVKKTSCANNSCVDDKNSIFTLPSKDSFELSKENSTENNSIKNKFEKIKEEQGLIGRAWDGVKNLFNLKSGSKNVQKAIEKFEAGEITKDEADEALSKYEKGQKMCLDVFADVTSGIVSVGLAAFAPVTGGASLLVAAGAGAAVKTGIKAGDAIISGRDYEAKDAFYDVVTGSLNGAIAPLSSGIGGVAGTGVAKLLGLETIETGVKSAGKSALANLLSKGGIQYAAGAGAKGGIKLFAKKAVAYGADMAVDGAISGAVDGFSRAVGEGRIEDIKDDTLEGLKMGLVASPIIGGATKLTFNGARKLSSNLLLEGTPHYDIQKANYYKSLTKDMDSYASECFNEAVDEAVKEGNVAQLRRTKNAYKLLSGDEKRYSKLYEVSAEAKEVLNSNNYTKNMLDDLCEVFGITLDKDFVKGDNGIYRAKSEIGEISGRAKGTDSIFSKVRNKVFELTSDLPKNFDETMSQLGDAQGARIVIKSSSNGEEELLKAAKKSFSGDELDDFIKFVKGEKVPKNGALRAKFQTKQTEVLEELNQEKTKGFVKKLKEGIESEKIRVTELHNYGGEAGLPYLNKGDVTEINDAYKKWFNKKLSSVKAGDTSEYFYDKATKSLVDKNTKQKFSSTLITKKGIKGFEAKANGYSAAQLNFLTKEGQPAELQYRGEMLDSLAEAEHIVYDLKKNKDTVRDSMYDEMRAVIEKIQGNKNAKKQYNEYFSDVFLTKRKLELGIDAKMPDISDYENVSAVLGADELNLASADGVVAFHKKIEEIKDASKSNKNGVK